MTERSIVRLADAPEWLERAALWFHEKWHVSLEAYRESIEESLQGKNPVPQWYLMVEHGRIVGGMGVIENDFHNRPDLHPNVCAVYVEPEVRCQGIAGSLLGYVCQDMAARDVDTLYLLTDHTGFYERYGWEFYGMVQGDGDPEPSRMYVHRMETS
jgi:N-acetylglutamate synthase-like GNAT family acetyltransferase